MTQQFAIGLTVVILGGLWITERCSARPELARRAYLVGIWGGVVGARLWYALQYGNFSLVGGWASWGFVFGASAGSVAYLRRRLGRWAFGDFADAAAPALALGGAVMRVNCFSIGCNFGSLSELPWSVTYAPGAPAYRKHLESGLIPSGAECSLGIHPTQLYESAFLFLVFVAIVILRRRPLARQLPGDLFLAGIISYSLFRFVVEFIRDDAAGLAFGPLTFAQASSAAALLLAWVVLRLRRSPKLFRASESLGGPSLS